MRSLISFVVTNRLFALIFVVIVLMLGWVKLPDLKISQYPDINIPMLTVNIFLPGASSLAIEKQIVNPVEEKLEEVRRVREVTSRVTNSFAQIAIEFERGVDVDDEYTDVYARINNLIPDLPAEVEIVVMKQNPMDRVVSFIIGVSSATANHVERLELAEELKREIREIRGLENLTVMKPAEEIRITLDLARLSQYGVQIEEVMRTVQQNNQFLPTGIFNIGDKAVSVLTSNAGYQSLSEISDTQVITRHGTSVAIKDIAVVSRGFSDRAIQTFVEGQPALWVTMKLSENGNVFQVRSELEVIVENIRERHPNVTFSWLFDVEEGVSDKFNELVGNIIQGILILGGLLLFAVGYRSAFIIATMLPVALILSVIGLSMTDYGIQEISLAGFIISLGLIVDSGIVVTENAYKLQTYSGYSREKAAIEGTASVMVPLISATATTALAFAPIFLLDSVTGLFLHSFVVTIWLCLGASLITAVAYAALLLARIGTDNQVRGLPTIPSFMNGLIPLRDAFYVRLLRRLIDKPTGFFLLVIVVFVGSLWLASRLDIIVFPDSEEPYFTVTLEADRDRSTDYMLGLVEEVREIAESKEGVESCAAVIGATFPAVHTGIRWLPNARNVGTVFCAVDFRDSTRLNKLADKINAELESLETDVSLDAAAFINGDGVDSFDIELELSGASITVLRNDARRLGDYLRDQSIPGITRINNPAESLWFALDIKYRRQAANALGVSRSAVDQVLALMTHGIEADELRFDSGETIPIMLKVDSSLEDPFVVFDRLFVTSETGQQIPLSQVVELSYTEDEFDIYHRQFDAELAIGLEVADDHSLATVSDTLKEKISGFSFSDGVRFNYGGQLAVSEDAFGDTGRFVGIIGLLILGIFVLQFRSLIQPLIVLAAIPLSFVGGFVFLWLADQPLSFLAFVGLTSLMGIVINNSILIVDEGNRINAQSNGMTNAEVAIEAGVNRFMPVVLTTLTTICGLLPLAIGDSMFKPLAIVVIGGLTTSTILTLLCVPVLFARLGRK